MWTIHIYLILFTILLSAVFSERDRKSEDWQYLVLAQQWPTTVCLTQKTHKCQIPSYISSWTIHGIWPTDTHSYPSFCNRSLSFNITAIKPIEDELLVVWPNLFTSETVDTFWKHEWLKHGTCAVSLPQLDTELKYFSTAIQSHNLYNILNFLKDDNIIPDEHRTYSMDHLHTAIENKTGKKAAFQCKHVKGYESPLILTISICMDKKFTLTDCPKKSNSCKSSIMYLPLTSAKPQNIYIFRLQQHDHILPITYVIAAGMVLLFIVMIFVWLFHSFKRNSADKMYTVFNDEKCSKTLFIKAM